MARVVMQAVVSVDGFIARPDDSVGPLFDWYVNGDTDVVARPSDWHFSVTAASAGYLQPFWDAVDVTHRPLPPEWLAAHPDAPFHVAGSVEAGIGRAKELAGDDGLVCVTAGDLGGQAFTAGLVDEVAMDVVPVVLGEGVRFFGAHAGTALLDDADRIVQGDRVLHLHYMVRH